MKRVFILIGLILVGQPLSAQKVIDKFKNRVNGNVSAIVEDKSKGVIYLGGDFTRAGEFAAFGGLLDKETGLVIGNNQIPNGVVTASFPDGNGGYYIGGDFTKIGNKVRKRVAHINSSGEITPWAENVGANGIVSTIFKYEETVYIGGLFTSYGDIKETSRGAVLSISEGLPIEHFPIFNGDVRSVVPDGSGGYFVGGDFTKVGDHNRNRLARIRGDGTLYDWNPNANGSIQALTVSEGIIYVGGSFTNIGGENRNRIAAIDVITGLATTWNPDASSTIRSIAVSEGVVYVGGNFETIGGNPVRRIAALDAVTGLVTSWGNSWNSSFGGIVNTLAVSEGIVYVGGTFSEIGGEIISHIAALDATTGMATSWNPNANWSVRSLAISGEIIYVGGSFTEIGGESRSRIAAIDVSTGLATSWNPDANHASVSSLAVSEGVVYVGGNFSHVGGQARTSIAALDADTGLVTSWNSNASGTVTSIAVSDGTLFAGGANFSTGGDTRNYIAALDANTGLAKSWNANANWSVQSITASEGLLYVGGAFTNIGGQDRNRIAALDISTGLASNWNPNANSAVRELVISGETVYAGGLFTSIGEENRNYIAALDKSTGMATSWNPNANWWVESLAISGETIYVGGQFTEIGGESRGRIAALDVDTSLPTSWNPDANSTVLTMVVVEDRLYAGGLFTDIGGERRNRLAELEINTGLATSWNPNPNGSIIDLAVSGGSVYAGGFFSTMGGQSRNRVASINATTGKLTSWNPNANSFVTSLELHEGIVYAGGAFTEIGGESRNFIAALDTDTGLAAPWNPIANSLVYSIVTSGNVVYAGGAFTNIGQEDRNYIAALDANTGVATPWNPNASSFVQSLEVIENLVYAGGLFTEIGEENRNHIAALDASTGLATAWNPNSNNWVERLIFSGNIIYVAGQFTNIGGQNRNYIAALDATTGLATAWNPNAMAKVQSLAVTENTVYAGGSFTGIGGKTRNFIAGLDASTGLATDWNPNANSRVLSLLVSEGIVYAGGGFNSINGEITGRFIGLDTRLAQTIRFDKLTDKIYGPDSFDLDGVSSSGLPITYASSNQSVASISGNTVSLLGAGVANITARQSGNAVYSSAEDVSQKLTIGQATLTATADDKSKTYGEVNPDFTISYAGFVNGDNVTDITEPSASTTADAGSDVGIYNISLSGGMATNYSITKNAGKLTISKAALMATADDKSKTYGEANPDFTISYAGFVNGDNATDITEPSASTTADAGSDVGIYNISLSGGMATNYSITKNAGKLTISKAALMATADDKSKTYGEANPDFTISYAGFVNGDNATDITEPSASTVADAGSDVGAYDISLSGGIATNYSITKNAGKLTISKAALMATADDKSKTYGEANPDFTISYAGFVNGDNATDITEPSASTVADAGSDVGAYDISLSGGIATNYSITKNAGMLTINKAALMATADDKSKTYGEANPDFTISYAGFVNGDNAIDITEPSASTTADASTDVGTVPITLTGGNANNYTLSTNDGTLTIDRAALTVTADDAQINKGDNLPDFTISYSGFVNGDDKTSLTSTPTATTTATASSERGEYPITISGGESTNYILNLVNGKLTITGPVYTLLESVDFGLVMLGDAPQQTISIENTGDGNLDVTGISLPEAYTIDQSVLTVSAGSVTGLQLTFTPTAAQVYAGTIQIESNNGIDEISLTGQGEIITGLDDDILDLNEVELFPNPVTDWLTIDMSRAPVDRAELKLFDANGQPVWNGFKSADDRMIMLNTSLYTNGVYLLTVSSKAGTIVKKVLIQR